MRFITGTGRSRMLVGKCLWKLRFHAYGTDFGRPHRRTGGAGPTAGPVAGVALTTYGGNGGLTQVDHVVHNGQVPTEEWRSATGTYTLNSNCTGTMQLIFSDGSPNLNLHIVVDQLLGQIRTVVDGDVAITSIGSRQVMPWSL